MARSSINRPPATSAPDSFTYTANDGDTTRPRTSRPVSITVVQVGYGFVNVKNHGAGGARDVQAEPEGHARGLRMEVHDRRHRGQQRRRAALGHHRHSLRRVTDLHADRVHDDFQFVYQALENKWDFDYQPKNAAVGTYYVIVRAAKTGQRFPESGPGFPVVFSRVLM